MAVVDSKALDGIRRLFQQQEELLREFAKQSLVTAAKPQAEESIESENESGGASELLAAQAELGAKFLQGVQPIFDSNKIRRYSEYVTFFLFASFDAHFYASSFFVALGPRRAKTRSSFSCS